jgi:hypothetical protein
MTQPPAHGNWRYESNRPAPRIPADGQPQLYELRVFRGNHEMHNVTGVRVPLDLSDVATTTDLLDGHLYGAVERCGSDRRDAHLYHLEVREIDAYRGRPITDLLFRWALPLDPEEVRRWQ